MEYSAALSGKLSRKYTISVEFFSEKPQGSHAENRIDGSFQFLALPNLQLDTMVGTGVFSYAPDMFVDSGLSVRLPM